MSTTLSLILIYAVLAFLGLTALVAVLYVLYVGFYWLCGDLMERMKELRGNKEE